MSEYNLGLFEHARPLPDQVTPERLLRAQAALAEFANYDPPHVMTSWALAERLRGLSSAVSDVVLARGSIATVNLTGMPGYHPDVAPPVLAQNAFERQYGDDAPAPELRGRSFMATPARHIGASLSLQKVRGTDRQLICEAIFPTDEDVDRAMQQPCQDWDDLVTHVYDFRTGEAVYPFHFGRSTHTAPRNYLWVAQELSAYLLGSSVPERV